MTGRYDAIVVGAGFAGATAARELATRGARVLVLEGDDRIGGRTRTARLSNGDVIELGGTYVHWSQPHTWSEITRYDLVDDVVEGGEAPEWALTPHEDGLAWIPAAQHAQRERDLLTRFFADSRATLPRPFQPLHETDRIAATDTMSIRDRIDQLGLAPGDQDLLEAFFTTHTVEPASRASFMAEMRWWAPSGHDYEALEEAVFGYRLRDGTVSLLSAILADGGAAVRLGCPVTAVESSPDGVRITTEDGTSHTAAVVVVATPSGVWPHIRFDPPLSPERISAAKEGMQARGGGKGFAVVRGERRRVYVQPRTGHCLGFLWTSHLRSEDEQVLVFFSTPRLRDPDDIEEVGSAIRSLLPDVEVVEVAGRRFGQDDPLMRGAWPVLKRGQLTRYAPHVEFLRPEGRVAFATSDIASAWTGYIDGAIEAGIVAARQIRPLLASASC